MKTTKLNITQGEWETNDNGVIIGNNTVVHVVYSDFPVKEDRNNATLNG